MLTPSQSLRPVIIAPDLVESVAEVDDARTVAERSRQLRIGLLQNGYSRVAVLLADTFLYQKLAGARGHGDPR